MQLERKEAKIFRRGQLECIVKIELKEAVINFWSFIGTLITLRHAWWLAAVLKNPGKRTTQTLMHFFTKSKHFVLQNKDIKTSH